MHRTRFISSFAAEEYSSMTASGTGSNQGDLLFVAAGTEHQFEGITEDLALWRVFYGPHGGEVSA
jgi:hypothetical protein